MERAPLEVDREARRAGEVDPVPALCVAGQAVRTEGPPSLQGGAFAGRGELKAARQGRLGRQVVDGGARGWQRCPGDGWGPPGGGQPRPAQAR